MCSVSYSQFPAPTSFSFSYNYIMLDQWADCADEVLYGPAYCNYFSWSPPDTSQAGAILDYYTIYLDDTPLTSVADTFYITDGAFIGKFYVTAVYRDPSGESDSSNVVYNWDLPIGFWGTWAAKTARVYYNRSDKTLLIRDAGDNPTVWIHDILGRKIYEGTGPARINARDFRPGIILVEIINREGRIFRQKILIE